MNRKAIATSLVLLFAATILAPLSTAQAGGTTLARNQQGVRDANGDGICDVNGVPVGTGVGQGSRNGKSWGPADGTGNMGNRPQDGTGWGAQSGRRSGPRDGSGPVHSTGSARRGGRR